MRLSNEYFEIERSTIELQNKFVRLLKSLMTQMHELKMVILHF